MSWLVQRHKPSVTYDQYDATQMELYCLIETSILNDILIKKKYLKETCSAAHTANRKMIKKKDGKKIKQDLA